jgi:DNA invertase Pin-like site-specific DNA recombinase
LSRNALDMITMLEECKVRGVGLRSITEPFDTNDYMGRFMFQLSGLLSELEVGSTSKRTTRGIEALRAEGHTWGPPRKMTEKQVQTAIKLLQGGKTPIDVAKKFNVSGTTLREKVLEATGGKKLWPSGPRAKR